MGYAAHPREGWTQMEDGRGSRRRVNTARTLDGRDVIVVTEVTPDRRYVAEFRKGMPEATLWDPIALNKLINDLRALQAIMLQGVRW